MKNSPYFMRPSEYILNPERLDNIINYAIILLLSILAVVVWTIIKGKELLLATALIEKKK